MQPAGLAEDAARFARVANERSDRIAAREHAADDFAADAAGGADNCSGHRAPFGEARSVPPPTASAPGGPAQPRSRGTKLSAVAAMNLPTPTGLPHGRNNQLIGRKAWASSRSSYSQPSTSSGRRPAAPTRTRQGSRSAAGRRP